MAEIPRKLIQAFESDDACTLDRIIKEGKREELQALQRIASDPSATPGYRRKALYALGRWKEPSSVSVIQKILPELDEAERISAIDALGRLGTNEAVASISEYIGDQSPNVRKFVVHALGRIGTTEAQQKLQEIKIKDPMNYIREMAATQLAKREMSN